MRKTYELKSGTLNTRFLVKDKAISVSFVGEVRGQFPRGGRFSTSDQALQKAIEKDPGFNVRFFCITEEPVKHKNIKSDKKDSVNEPIEKSNEDIEAEELDETNEESTEKIETHDEISNAQEAKEFLLKKFTDLNPDQVSNKKLILKVAKEKGISFPKVR